MNAVILSTFRQPGLAASEPAIAEKRRLLDEAACIKAVSDDLSVELASQTLVAIRGLTKACEESRIAVKAPVLKLGKDIDAVAAAFSAELTAAATRIGRLVAAYQAEQARKAAEAERIRQEEIARIERERREAEERSLREAAEAAAKAKSKEEAEAAIARAQQQAEEAARAAQQRVNAVVTAPAPVQPVKLAGVTVRKVWKFEVLDVKALHAARPELVELQPRRSEINSVISAGDREIPGLRIWEENESRVRA